MIGLKVRQIPDVGEPKDFMFEISFGDVTSDDGRNAWCGYPMTYQERQASDLLLMLTDVLMHMQHTVDPYEPPDRRFKDADWSKYQ